MQGLVNRFACGLSSRRHRPLSLYVRGRKPNDADEEPTHRHSEHCAEHDDDRRDYGVEEGERQHIVYRKRLVQSISGTGRIVSASWPKVVTFSGSSLTDLPF